MPDTNWLFLAGGSTNASDANPHNLFGGTYGGLSQLNISEVVTVKVAASTGLGAIGPSGVGTQPHNAGIFLGPSNQITLLPMLRQDASQLYLNRVGVNGPIVYWQIWVRRPL